MVILYRVALPDPLPSHRLIFGAALASVAFVIATLGLRIYLRYITGTGYTYGALATPIAFLLFAFFAGFSIMLGAEFNAAIQEEWAAPRTHAHRMRRWLVKRAKEVTEDVGARLAVLEEHVHRAVKLIEELREANARLAQEKTTLESALRTMTGDVERLRERDQGRLRLEAEYRRLLDDRRQLLGQVEGILKELARIEGL